LSHRARPQQRERSTVPRPGSTQIGLETVSISAPSINCNRQRPLWPTPSRRWYSAIAVTVNGFGALPSSDGPVAISYASSSDRPVSSSEYSQEQPRQKAAAAGLTGGKIVGWLI
jgi:hypothetical protein